MPVKCMSILLTECSEPVLVLFLDYITHKAQLLGFYNQMSIKSVLCTEGKFSVFFRVYEISTFRLFIKENSCSRPGGGGTLGISGWGCAAGTLEPLTYTRASSAEFCYPILE